MSVPSLAEQRALTVARVRDHFTRTGALPAELVRYVQGELARHGRIVSQDQARDLFLDYLDAWAEVFLREADNRSASERRADMRRRANNKARLRVVARHTKE